MSPRINPDRRSPRLSAALGACFLWSSLVLLAAIVSLPELTAAEPAPSKQGTKTEPFDVLYLSDARPIVVRLHITTDGKSLPEAWNRFADVLFAKLDTNKNGTIDDKELTNLRPMLMFLTGQFGRVPADLAPAQRNMNRAEFGEFLKKNDFGPLRIQAPVMANRNRPGIRRMGAATPEDLDKALLELLDTNKDGKISVAEFTAGIEILSKLDADENELISTEEILRRPEYPFFVQDMNNMSQTVSPGVELLPLVRKGKDENLARRMLIRYGPKPPAPNPRMPGMGTPSPRGIPQQEPTVRRLTKKDLKLSDELFAALDQDGDDELDAEELGRFGQNAKPEVELAIRLGKQASGVKAAEVIRGGNAPLKVYATPRGSEIALEVPGVRLDLMSSVGYADIVRTFHNYYLNRFRNLDGDANGYLDKNEAANDPVFRDLFAFFDKDGDGKIFEKELKDALDEVDEILTAAASGIASIELSESSRGLFGLIDADGDGKLSIPELRAMPKLVERFGSSKDGTLAPGDVPRRFEATIAPGIAFGRAGNAAQFARRAGQYNPPKPQVGPLWFQKMDRNRDGFVSRREFLGTDEEFRKLDLDGDGLISVEEAEAAGKKEEGEASGKRSKDAGK